MKRRFFWAITAVNIVLVITLIACSAIIFTSASNNNVSLFGYKFFFLKGTAIDDELKENCLIGIEESTTFNVDDMVAFYIDINGTQEVAVKNIIGVTSDTLELQNEADVVSFKLIKYSDDIIGKVTFSSNTLGEALYFISTPNGKIMTLAIMISAVLVICLFTFMCIIISRKKVSISTIDDNKLDEALFIKASNLVKNKAELRDASVSSVKPQDVVEQVTLELAKAEPTVAEVVKAEPTVAEVVKVEPTVAEVVKAEPTVAEVVKAEPTVAEVVKAEPTVAVKAEDDVVLAKVKKQDNSVKVSQYDLDKFFTQY